MMLSRFSRPISQKIRPRSVQRSTSAVPCTHVLVSRLPARCASRNMSTIKNNNNHHNNINQNTLMSRSYVMSYRQMQKIAGPKHMFRQFSQTKQMQNKALVGCKRVVDYSIKVRVRPDKKGVDLNNVKMSINPFDEIAVEEALKLKEAGHLKEVVAVSVGPDACQDTLRHALAMGADRAILVTAPDNVEPLALSKIFKKLVEKEQPELVILGKQAIDADNNQTGQMIAAQLNWPQGTFISKVDFQEKQLKITREVDGGLQNLTLALPAVLTCDLRLNTPRYTKLAEIMKAKKKPFEKIAVADLGVDVTPRVEVVQVEDPPTRKQGVALEGVDALVEPLQKLGFF